jgi:hypothetical protein
MTNEQVRQSLERENVGTEGAQVEQIQEMIQQKERQGGHQQSQDLGPHDEAIADGGMGTATGDPEAESLEGHQG